jgi:hypothetical protein
MGGLWRIWKRMAAVELAVVLEPAVLQIKAENKIGTETMQWKGVKYDKDVGYSQQ